MSASKEQVRTIQATELDETMVRDYLVEHGDFLQQNPDLMDHLHISHASGSAVSLVEKQVSVLRERNVEMRRRLTTLTNNAKDNDTLYDQTRKLVLRLLDAEDTAGLFQAFLHSMQQDFKVEHATMILFSDQGQSSGPCRYEQLATVREQIGGLLRGGKPMCGALREEELAFLFSGAGHPGAGLPGAGHPGAGSGQVGSAAVTPFGNGEPLGLIAVGSSDANRYTGTMGTLFLTHIADVIMRLLPRLQG